MLILGFINGYWDFTNSHTILVITFAIVKQSTNSKMIVSGILHCTGVDQVQNHWRIEQSHSHTAKPSVGYFWHDSKQANFGVILQKVSMLASF